jgi:hypothetical protein
MVHILVILKCSMQKPGQPRELLYSSHFSYKVVKKSDKGSWLKKLNTHICELTETKECTSAHRQRSNATFVRFLKH